MNIIEKLYAGKSLDEYERKCLAYGDGDLGEYEWVDEVGYDSGRWSQSMETIFKVGDDLWAVPWQRGLTEYQENEFYDQPYRVVKKTRVITETYYETLGGTEVTM